MKIDLGERELQLREHCPLRLSEANGVTVRCTRGVLWMTITGDAGDILLASGESYRIRGAGRIVIESIGGDASVRFEHGVSIRLARAMARIGGKMRRLVATAMAAARLSA